jgi:hypothetical protein
MTRELVFVHGPAQEHKDSVSLKKEWIDALNKGLAKSGLSMQGSQHSDAGVASGDAYPVPVLRRHTV